MNSAGNLLRVKASIRGAVQGVGFRPFVFRLATELKLRGRVLNTGGGVFIEAEGRRSALETFLSRLRSERPPRSSITSLESTWLEPAGLGKFAIVQSIGAGPKRALIMPDIATCPDCTCEIFDPGDRRYFYPFTNCVHCGPRFSIINAVPYDRLNTSMRVFEMCPQCRAEYEDPANRRFHAQPNACPACGPHIELRNAEGEWLSGSRAATHNSIRETLLRAVDALRSGGILALKGLGGFHLITDARNDAAVRALRERKKREEKPFAVMFPSITVARGYCEISAAEETLLASPESPIVLLRKRADARVPLSEQIAPGNPMLGAMLPYTPLHLLLLHLFDSPVVATSGNLSDEPICTDEREAVACLAGIADLFLVHNRPIVRHVDDSIVRIVMGRELVLRRARGYAPLPVTLSAATSECVLAVGAHLKNTVALSVEDNVFLSQHIGDLETDAAFNAFERVSADLPRLYSASPSAIAADAHPGYLSTRFAHQTSATNQIRLVTVQHHVSHVLSCMAENELCPPALGVSWDGTGYGPDETVWGGEFFEITERTCRRVGHFRQFRLPGGETAVKEPRRCAAGILHEIFGESAFEHPLIRKLFDPAERAVIKQMLARGINAPKTSSAGRLFDAVAALTGLRQVTRHEGQAAMELEFAAGDFATDRSWKAEDSPSITCFDWEPMIRGILSDLDAGVSCAEISAVFHNSLAQWILAAAKRLGHEHVALSGGCFQNARLLETAISLLTKAGFRPVWHQRVPPNDGGIALGQVIAAMKYPYFLSDGTQSAENPEGGSLVAPS